MEGNKTLNPYIIGFLLLLAVVFIILNTTHKAFFLGLIGYTLLFYIGIIALAGSIEYQIQIINPPVDFSFQDSNGGKGLYIADSHSPIEKAGTTRELYIHVYKNDLTAITGNASVNCSYHLYNNTNDVVNINFANESIEYKVVVPGIYIKTTGEYSFIISCKGNSPINENGVLSSHFTVTDTGRETNYWSDGYAHTLGFLIAIAGVFGFIITLTSMRSDMRGPYG